MSTTCGGTHIQYVRVVVLMYSTCGGTHVHYVWWYSYTVRTCGGTHVQYVWWYSYTCNIHCNFNRTFPMGIKNKPLN